MTQPGVVLCSRLASRRLPNKPLIPFLGKPAIRILAERLLGGPFPVCLATPPESEDDGLELATVGLSLLRFRGHRANVLARLYWAAMEHDFDPIIRVTHDDLFVDTEMMAGMVDTHRIQGNDYTFVAKCLRGADCEVVSRAFVERALKLHGDREGEFLSYTFRRPELNAKIGEYFPPDRKTIHARLSMDWPEDVLAIQIMLESMGLKKQELPTTDYIVAHLRENPSVLQVNKQPIVSVYTCAFNAEKTIRRCIDSVLSQKCDIDFEYIVYDDGSRDQTAAEILSYGKDKRLKPFRNGNNTGLATACNRALKDARGKYLIRVDADDELLPNAIFDLVTLMQGRPDIVAAYPAYYKRGEVLREGKIQNTDHHMGGAIIRSWAYNELKFCDGMRHLEGKEFFERLSARFAYLESDTPTWIYHQRPDSLSHQDTEERRRHEAFLEK